MAPSASRTLLQRGAFDGGALASTGREASSPLSRFFSGAVPGGKRKLLAVCRLSLVFGRMLLTARYQIGIEYKPRRGDSNPLFRQLKHTHKDVIAVDRLCGGAADAANRLQPAEACATEHNFDERVVMLDTPDHSKLLRPMRCNISAGTECRSPPTIPGKRTAEMNDMKYSWVLLTTHSFFIGFLLRAFPPASSSSHQVQATQLPVSHAFTDLRHNWYMYRGEVSGPSHFPPLSPTEMLVDMCAERVGNHGWLAPRAEVLSSNNRYLAPLRFSESIDWREYRSLPTGVVWNITSDTP
ncbi:hypothetical protein AURDEDRAFT_121088 [Auricularia subglabra TFB-10046 SS5]|nr:hypothetical protein AURDEDRAFT_121088 [Auricularia subglabra TFB-10046 SS5]